MSSLRELRQVLRKSRDALGYTQRDVAEALEWSPSKVIRIENGQVGLSVTDLKALLLHYKITDTDRVDQLVELLRAGKKPAWWHKYKDFFQQQFLTFLGFEASAIRIRQFQALVIPGLLATRDYSHALFTSRNTDPVQAERGLEVRAERQAVLVESGPEMFFILDEGVLHRRLGSAEVMRAQLEHLKKVAALPNVRIQVVPFTAGAHQGMWGSFEIFEMSSEENDFAMVLERPEGDELIEDIDRATGYVKIFFELEHVALSPEESIKLIDRVLEGMGESS